jgi:heme/copper-type cytochrome/quinol oxidase subunit 3
VDAPVYTAQSDGVEPAELLARNIRLGARVWAASVGFFFVAFFFAFLYLRALDTGGLWRGWPHHHPTPSMAFGVAILVCVLASAAVARASAMLEPARWRIGAIGALLFSLAAIGLQCAQFSSLGFGPTDAGYASVFVGWTGLFTLFLFGTTYWLATVVADVSGDGATPAFQAAAIEGVSFVLIVLAGVEVAAFILLYLVV